MQNLAGVADRGDHQKGAKVSQEIERELVQVGTVFDHLVYEGQDALQILPGDQVTDGEEQLAVDHAQQIDHRLVIDLVAAEGDDLVEQALPVPQAAVGRDGDHRQAVIGDLHSLRLDDLAEPVGDLDLADAPERVVLAAGQHGLRDLVRLGRCQHEHDVRGWLLERLQQRVEGAVGEHVGLVDDEHPVAVAGRRVANELVELPDIVDARLRCGVHLDDVEVARLLDLDTGVAFAAGIRGRGLHVAAVQPLRQEPGDRRLADPADARKAVGVRQPTPFQGIAEGPDDRRLAHDLLELLRPPLAGQNLVMLVGHGRSGKLRPIMVLARFRSAK